MFISKEEIDQIQAHYESQGIEVSSDAIEDAIQQWHQKASQYLLDDAFRLIIIEKFMSQEFKPV